MRLKKLFEWLRVDDPTPLGVLVHQKWLKLRSATRRGGRNG